MLVLFYEDVTFPGVHQFGSFDGDCSALRGTTGGAPTTIALAH